MIKDLYNDKELFRLIAQGDEAAFNRLFDQYRNHLYYLTYSLTRSAVIAEDVLQEVFLRVWMHRSELPAIENFPGYLAVMTRRVVLNELRRLERLKKREQYFGQRSLTVVPDEMVDRLQEKQYNSLLQSALQQLPSQQATVFRMIRQQSLSRNETARELGLSPETVKKHLERAMKTVRAFMLAHLDDTILLVLALLF